MIALIQRVRSASVHVENRLTGEIGPGLLALIGIQRADDANSARRLLDKLLAYRVFGDDSGRMNRSLSDTVGGLLLVSQFTLAADTKKGTRPSFTPAAPPEEARELFDHFVELARTAHPDVATGEFGADMQVSLVNDGPVTFWLEV
ncbi:D-aminoacyl-tRNA deacylase [Uliginosibacterium aquaticum]|uniref:D-aminoacyl-tRNA deacylase n=1 Tax=Uliginosibacterium aquaticum TaxID=2731212 RepID=A0ABX2ILX1_9RHOO|nr:D-aminoacyl-tRNA deacylase [Uliginosibacterium aquaticum]NSL55316.1 D-tyrosyl-tRNA(Tyr) deacylase [Uliginosibacterium aquaticum]